MRAVNLLPKDLRGAGGGNATGPASYVLLGVLAAAVVLVSVWAFVQKQISDRETQLSQVTAEATSLEARADQLAPYIKFAEVRAKRVETVTQLSRSRFNWPYALREVSRVLPKGVWLTGLTGTVAPGVQIDGASTGSTNTLRAQIQSPAVEITGCTDGQDTVAELIVNLRRIEGVTRVSIARSQKPNNAGGSGGASAAPAGAAEDGDCTQGSDKRPQFDLVVFFEKSTAQASTLAPGEQPANDSSSGSGSGSGGDSTSTTPATGDAK